MSPSEAKWALITGASLGLGRALAEECAARGMSLVLVALSGTGLDDVARTIRRSWQVQVEILEIDLTERGGIDRLLDKIAALSCTISLLVNNAGVGYKGLFVDSTLEQNETTVKLNVLSLVRLTHCLLPSLSRDGTAHILNVASLGAFFPMPYLPVYSPTKSFVVNFSLALREELFGAVGVSVLCPNGIRTNRATRDEIERQGFAARLTCHYPDQVARAAITGLLRNRAIIVPGIVNRIVRLLAMFVPRPLAMGVVRRHWGAAGGERERISRGALDNRDTLRVGRALP